jgi:drug/metabolite transporter (DMT)-like permease
MNSSPQPQQQPQALTTMVQNNQSELSAEPLNHSQKPFETTNQSLLQLKTHNTPITSPRRLSVSAFLTLVLIGFMMGSNHVAARFAFNDGLDIATAVLVRSSITALIVGSVIYFQKVPRKLNPLQIRSLIVLGLLISLQSVCLYSAVARLPVALALLCFNTYPLWAALFSRVLFKKVIEPRVLQLMPFMIIGLAMALDIFGAASGLGANAHWAVIGVGVTFALLAAAAFGFALIVTEQYTQGVDGRVRTICSMLMVALLTLLYTIYKGGPQLPNHSVGWVGLACLTALYGSAFTIMFTVLPKLGAVGNSGIMNVEPICALVMAWWLLDQKISEIQVIGALIVVAVVITLGMRKSSPPKS